MWQRCTNPNNNAYKNYGGRGISVCKRWKNFANFYADMGSRPSIKHELDREKNNLGYSPKNCRWVLSVVQARNRRNNRLITLNGKTLTVAAWSEIFGISRYTVYKRLDRGWNVARALTT
jgi:hypothetical protein